MLDRVERSDVFNATALAAVLLVFGFLTISAFGWFTGVVDEGLWTAEGGDEVSDATDAIGGPLLKPTNEVVIRVGNGSDGRQGLAGRATRKLEDLGYGVLEPKNREGDPLDESFVYYIDGFKLEGIQIATILQVAESQVRPLLDAPGVPIDGADLIVILGQDADF